VINGISINRAPINSRGNIGAAERMSVSAGAGASAAVTLNKRTFISVNAGAGVRTTSVSIGKIKYLGAALGAGVTKVVSDMDLFKSATGQTLTYLSVTLSPVAKMAAAPLLAIDGQMPVNVGVSASVSATMNVWRALGANATASANAFDNGFFSNAYMQASLYAKADITVLFQNQRGLSVSATATADAGSSAPSLLRNRALSVNASATAAIAPSLGRVWSLGATLTATASIGAGPALSKLKIIAVSARAEANANVSLGVNIFASAPASRIIYVPYSPRIVYVTEDARQNLVSPH
jgi:hypothetical protein